MSLTPSKPLLQYVIAIESSLGALLAQHNEEARSMPYIILARQWLALN